MAEERETGTTPQDGASAGPGKKGGMSTQKKVLIGCGGCAAIGLFIMLVMVICTTFVVREAKQREATKEKELRRLDNAVLAGIALAKKGDTAGAIRQFQIAEQNGTLSDAQSRSYGEILLANADNLAEKGELQRAVKDYEQAARRLPTKAKSIRAKALSVRIKLAKRNAESCLDEAKKLAQGQGEENQRKAEKAAANAVEGFKILADLSSEHKDSEKRKEAAKLLAKLVKNKHEKREEARRRAEEARLEEKYHLGYKGGRAARALKINDPQALRKMEEIALSNLKKAEQLYNSETNPANKASLEAHYALTQGWLDGVSGRTAKYRPPSSSTANAPPKTEATQTPDAKPNLPFSREQIEKKLQEIKWPELQSSKPPELTETEKQRTSLLESAQAKVKQYLRDKPDKGQWEIKYSIYKEKVTKELVLSDLALLDKLKIRPGDKNWSPYAWAPFGRDQKQPYPHYVLMAAGISREEIVAIGNMNHKVGASQRKVSGDETDNNRFLQLLKSLHTRMQQQEDPAKIQELLRTLKTAAALKQDRRSRRQLHQLLRSEATDLFREIDPQMRGRDLMDFLSKLPSMPKELLALLKPLEKICDMLVANQSILNAQAKALASKERDAQMKLDRNSPIGAAYKNGFSTGRTRRKKALGRGALLRILEKNASSDGSQLAEKAGHKMNSRQYQAFQMGYLYGILGWEKEEGWDSLYPRP